MIRTSRSVCHFCAILSFILDRSETQFDSAPRIIRHTASKSPCDFVKGSPDLDSKYAWLVCLTGFIANAVGVGVIVAFAIYIPLLSEKLNASESDVSWAGSICLCINNGAGLFVGKLLSKYGAKISSICAAVLFFLGFFLTGYATAMWHVYITYGVMIGIASCIVFLQAVVVVGQFFERRRSIALGLAIAGVGVGMMIIPHITEALVDSFGWRSAFKIQGVYCAVVVALTALVYRSTRAPVKEAGQLEGEDLTSQSSEDPEYIEIVPAGMSPVRYWHFHRTYTELLFDKTVLLFVISLALYAFSSFIPTLYIVRLLFVFFHSFRLFATVFLRFVVVNEGMIRYARARSHMLSRSWRSVRARPIGLSPSWAFSVHAGGSQLGPFATGPSLEDIWWACL
eukprot:m.61064 g.61064  ORF g.61064 m.61064 type:complete len:397 (+) comp49419_c0_seq9:137-1327(+)